jgi:malic enzyme
MFAGAWCVHVSRSRSYEFDCVDLCRSEPLLTGQPPRPFIATYIETAHQLFPNAMLHFEDFGPEHARAILARYSLDYYAFNDDVQGTGAVVMAAVYSGLKSACRGRCATGRSRPPRGGRDG